MTAEEWLTSTEPVYMAANVPFSRRKHRLFAVVCCWRLAAQYIHDETLWNGVGIAERFADGGCTEAEFSECESQVRQVFEELESRDPGTDSVVMRGDYVRPVTYAALMVRRCLSSDARTAAQEVPYSAASAVAGTWDEGEPRFQAEFAAQADLLRDIFGNPFRPVSFDAEWRTSTAVMLAQQMYESRDFSTMPILADALQDADCANEDILNHCRDTTATHVRGCWVVDLVLGKQ